MSDRAAVASQLCTFRLDDMMFAVDVKHVQEVIRYQEMTSVPLASRYIRGLINLRGQIVTAIDMRARLDLDEEGRSLPMNVVVKTGEGVVSLLVDEIGDVLQPELSAFEEVPENLAATLKEMLGGIYKLDKGLLLLVDVEKLMASNGAGDSKLTNE